MPGAEVPERRRERIRAALTGLAVGDRNGGPSRMALELAASLVARRGFDPGDVFRRYRAWYAREGFDTGPVVAAVLDRVARGMPCAAAVAAVDRECGGRTAGCNPAHRVLPLALCAQVRTEVLPRLAREEAALTHAHPIAGDGAAVYACLARRLLDGTPWDEAFTVDAAEVDGELAQRLALRVGAPLSRGGFTPDALVAAIHFVDQAGDFEQALEASFAFAGAANYCPVLVGPLAGLRWGVPEATGYPPVNRPLRARLEGLAERLAELVV